MVCCSLDARCPGRQTGEGRLTGMALARLEEMEARSRQGGGPERLARQHARGKMSARERLEALLDPSSFFEVDTFATDRVRTGKCPWEMV
jgi:acetyl-CoA carboxylase carboxyltransferase component